MSKGDEGVVNKTYNLLQIILVVAGGIATILACVIAFLSFAAPQDTREFVFRWASIDTPTPIVQTVIITVTPEPDTPVPPPTSTPKPNPTPMLNDTPNIEASVQAAIAATQAALPTNTVAAIQAPTSTPTPSPTQATIINSEQNPSEEGPSWWDTNYSSRDQLVIGNEVDMPLPVSYSVRLDIAGEEASSLFRKSTSAKPGDDIRIVFWDGSQWQEIDRIIDTFTSTQIELWFATKTEVAPNSVSEDYWIYSDNTEALDPPADASRTFLWWDDFSSNTLSSYTVWRADISKFNWQRGTITYDEFEGRLSVLSGDNIAVLLQPPVSEKNLIMEGDMYLTKIFPKSGMYQGYIRVLNTNNFYASSFPVSYYNVTIGKNFEGKQIRIAEGGKLKFPIDNWHHVEIAAYEDRIESWINDVQVAANDEEHEDGGIGLGITQANGYIDNIRVRRYVIPEPSVFFSN